MTKSPPGLQAYVARVVDHERRTRPRFEQLYRSDVITHPIPFFGDICTASILTVGVNPSATEFIDRRWPQNLSAVELADRLHAYFLTTAPPSHAWFEGWQEALAILGVSYRNGAAHLDLSARATVSMGATDQVQFARMVEEDVEAFFDALPFCRAARALLLAGCVTKRWYADDFLRRVAPRFGFTLSKLSATSGRARTSHLQLDGPNVSLPVFFCSVSPSAREGKAFLALRIRENASLIGSWLATPTSKHGSEPTFPG